MKKFLSKRKNCYYTLFSLIFSCETLLTIDNKIIQSMGVLLAPVLIVYVILFMIKIV